MHLRKAVESDLQKLCDLYRRAGIDESRAASETALGLVYCMDGVDGPELALSHNVHPELPGQELGWLFGVRPGSVFRIAVNPASNDPDIHRLAFESLQTLFCDNGCDSLRFEIMEGSPFAAFCEAAGMRMAGSLKPGNGTRCMYYETRLTDDCPLLPLRMRPAFRGGKLTPWGGERLRTVMGKDIREVPTGESLEVSCIPGLESTDLTGVTLPELVSAYGRPFAGRFADGAFPLLLKLIDAREALSVQVHPDNTYAHDHEGGKFGKTEAWLILDAPEGSQLVYGIQPGTTLAQLREACENGPAVESLLRKVTVRPGDVCYIPAGCVHAIGPGILLYEIQQSSDITYRFYDWNRVDQNGRGRELHLKQALAVTDLGCAPAPLRAPQALSARVLDRTYFTLDLFQPQPDAPVSFPSIQDFGLLTALDEGLALSWEGCRIELHKGESLFIPYAAPALTLTGSGRAALSMPR